jgi:hypothetical protein
MRFNSNETAFIQKQTRKDWHFDIANISPRRNTPADDKATQHMQICVVRLIAVQRQWSIVFAPRLHCWRRGHAFDHGLGKINDPSSFQRTANYFTREYDAGS